MRRRFADRAPVMAVAVLLLAAVGVPVMAQPLVLLVQPPALGGDVPAFDARPLATVLSRVLGETVRARVSDDALSHWHAVAAPPDYDLAFDEAHFTDYRIRRHGFDALVREAADIRFQVLVRPRTLLTGPSDLAARLVASPAPPSLGAVRLMALFPRITRAPRLLVVDSSADALDTLIAGRVEAALLPAGPTPVSAAAVPALFTDVSPGRGLSVSRLIADERRIALTRALVTVTPSAELRQALTALGVDALEMASNEVYEDSARLLRGTWGYR